MSDEKDVKDLRWIRIFTPIHIPKYLIEQVKDRDWKVDDYIRYHELNCTTEKDGQQTLNPFSHLYVLVNADNITKGYLWFTIEPLTKDICIQNYSIDKEYWGKGRAVEKLADHIKYIKKKANLNKVYWITNYPKHSQKYGFKQSKSVLMEYTEEQDGQNIHGGSNTRKEHQHVDSRTNPISEQCARGSGGTSGAGVSTVLAAV